LLKNINKYYPDIQIYIVVGIKDSIYLDNIKFINPTAK